MRVLISGCGIAGATLAYWLARYGIKATIVEKAPKLRTGGYIIDFWGLGYDIADRMSLLQEIRDKGYFVREVRVVNRNGIVVSGFPVDVFDRMTGGRYVSIPRGELAAIIYRKIPNKVETTFGDSIRAIEETSGGIQVTFDRGAKREFDIVVGADGLHSRVRELVFGPESHFEKYLGYKVAAFAVDGYEPRDELIYVMFTEVGQQVARFAMRDNRSMFLFTFADDNPETGIADNLPAQKALLRWRFGHSGWECPRILDALDSTPDLYFDRVSQIRMDTGKELWSRGAVTLLGDAACCVSLLAGQGAALAMAGAYLLATELHKAGGDHVKAFQRYEGLFAPFVGAKQRAALRLGGLLAPKSKTSLFVRNQIMKLLKLPFVAELGFARDLKDNLVLPQ